MRFGSASPFSTSLGGSGEPCKSSHKRSRQPGTAKSREGQAEERGSGTLPGHTC